MTPTMLIQDFVQVDSPYDAVRPHFDVPGVPWLASDAQAAYRDGEEISVTLRPESGPLRIGKRVHVDVGPPRCRGETIIIPVSWCATGATRLFPTMEADLEIAPFGASTVLTLMGRYEPPLGAIGRGLDRMFMHRVAAASVRAFLQRVAATLLATAAA